MKAFVQRWWHSPTLNTWASFATRSLTFVIVLPLLLRKFSPEELTVWYLFATLASLHMLAESGFGSTFVRMIAYAMSGASDLQAAMAGRGGTQAHCNLALLGQIVGTMRTIYQRLTLLLAVLLGLGGTWALVRPLAALPDPRAGWIGWVLVYANTLLVFQGNFFSTWLQGTNQIAVLRRWETFTSLGSIFTSFLLLKVGAGLLPLVAATQMWATLGVARNAWLALQVLDGRLRTFRDTRYCPTVFGTVWPSAWRAGVGVLMSFGVTQSTGLVYAQMGRSRDVAAYLLALRLQQMIVAMSNAPFYSKLPLLSRWWAEGAHGRIVSDARRAKSLTLWALAFPLISIGLLGPNLFKWIESQTPFPAPWIWWLLGIAALAERYGAIHLQLYSLSNHIIWHIANGIAGSIQILASIALYPHHQVAAFPIAALCGGSFYLCYSVIKYQGLVPLEHRLAKTADIYPLIALLTAWSVNWMLNITDI